MSSRIPFRRGPRASREKEERCREKEAEALPQAGQGRARRHRGPRQGQVVRADGPRPGQVALDGGRRGGPQPHRGQGGPARARGVRASPDDACPRLLSWPRCCSAGAGTCAATARGRWRCGTRRPGRRRSRDAELRESRIGVDRDEAGFEYAMGLIRCDVARGLSPQQIALGRAGQIGLAPRPYTGGYPAATPGMCDLDLRRKCGYKPRSRAEPPRRRRTAGRARSPRSWGCPREARRRLRDGHRDRAQGRPPVPADIVPEGVQVPARAADARTRRLRRRNRRWTCLKGSRRPPSPACSLLLTDNGAEFSTARPSSAPRSTRPPGAARSTTTPASPSRGGCERNHVELRKILPKGAG